MANKEHLERLQKAIKVAEVRVRAARALWEAGPRTPAVSSKFYAALDMLALLRDEARKAEL